jgi:hypothetical protein
MSIIDDALSANATMANGYDPSRGGPPEPKIAIVTCADPRLTSIEQMLGLAAGDVDMIRNFGTVIGDDAVRSLVLSTRLLGEFNRSMQHRVVEASVAARRRLRRESSSRGSCGAGC